MTREQAKKEWIARAYPLEGYRFDEIIDEIYDYFESRTCENCKYYGKIWFRDCTISGCEKLRISVGQKSYCNKYEAKED